MRFSDGLRTQFPQHAGRLDELEGFLAAYDTRFKRRLISQESKPRRLLGHRATHVLLTCLSRARFLTATVIHCANGGLAPGMYLAVRAHWEVTGLVAHLLLILRKFYGGQLSERDFDATMAKLALGRRWEVPSMLEEDVTAINAITLVGSAARLLGHAEVEQHVRDCYDFLSEHCHPNLFGRLTGVTLSDDLRIIEYDPAFALDESALAVCLSHGASSHALFLHAYDQCFELLNQHEEMPTLEA